MLKCYFCKDLKKINLIIFLFLAFGACKKESCDGNVPVATFDEVRNSSGTTIVVLGVLDCDGDIGLSETESTGDYKFNAFIDIRPFRNGEWDKNTFDYSDMTITEIKDDSGIVVGYDTIIDVLNYYYRVPVVDNNSRSDIFEAKIELDLGTTFFGFDTFRFEGKINDKALNTSNTVISETQYSRN